MKRSIGVRKLAGLLLFLAAGTVLQAEDSFSFFVENDSRYLKPNGKSDRHYTNGIKLVYTTQPKWAWLEDFANWGGTEGEPTDAAVGFFLGQNIYTPDHPEDGSRRGSVERRFAGWLYTGMFVERRQGNMLDHVELNVGMIGPSSRADSAQRCIHNLIDSDKSVGWDTQLGDDPAADFTWVRKFRHTEGLLKPTNSTDFITDMGFTAGSLHCNAEAGIMLRWGGALPDDFGPGRLALPTSAAGRDAQWKQSFYLFSRLAGRAVAHDRFLTGLTPQPFVGLASVGLVWRFDTFELGYSQTFMTKEFKEKDYEDSFGAVTLTWLF